LVKESSAKGKREKDLSTGTQGKRRTNEVDKKRYILDRERRGAKKRKKLVRVKPSSTDKRGEKA